MPYSFILLKVGCGCGEYFANEDGKFKARVYRFSQKSGNHFKTIRPERVIQSNFRPHDPPTLGGTTQNLVMTAT